MLCDVTITCLFHCVSPRVPTQGWEIPGDIGGGVWGEILVGYNVMKPTLQSSHYISP